MKKTALVVMVAVVAGAAIFAFSGCGGTKVEGVPDTVATVNGQSISSANYLSELHRRIGQDVLRNMIEQEILIQWAKDEKVPVTDEQMKKQIEVLKRDGAYDDQVQYLGEEALKRELTAMQARINLAKKNSDVSEDEVKEAYEAMKARYVHGPRKRVAIAISSKKSDMKKLKDAVKGGKDFEEATMEFSNSPFITRGSAKMWVEEDKMALTPELTEAANKTKNGELSDVFTLAMETAPTQYAVLKVVDEQKKANPSFKDVKGEVEDMVALNKSRMDPDFQTEFNERKKKAKIDVGITEYKSIVQSFKNPPEPMMMGGPQPAPQPAPEEAPKSEKK